MTHEEYIEQEFVNEIQSAYSSCYDKYYAMCNDSRPSGFCLDICKETVQITSCVPNPFSSHIRIVGGLVGCGVEHWWLQVDRFVIDDFYSNDTHIPKTELIDEEIIKYT